MSCPVWIPKAAPGCLEPAPASLSTHGVVVLGNHRRALEVALTPIHLGTLVGKYARHRQAPWEKGEEQVSGGHRGGEERAAHPKGPRSSHVWHLPAQPSALPGYQGLILFPTHILLLKSSSLPSMQEVQITPENGL